VRSRRQAFLPIFCIKSHIPAFLSVVPTNLSHDYLVAFAAFQKVLSVHTRGLIVTLPLTLISLGVFWFVITP